MPDGFVVGARHMRRFWCRPGCASAWRSCSIGVDVEDTAALRAAGAAAREMFDADPDTGAAAARDRGATSDSPVRIPAPVAVRSSATAEDTAATSFAGMNETFLNVRGADAVIDAVRRCWRSLFGARTIYYRGVNGFAQADMDIAVVVQRQVNSTRAGVMFTVNPATGERDELVIEAPSASARRSSRARSPPTATS